jgi:drug/metabolite transporter (DMT)-like permease
MQSSSLRGIVAMLAAVATFSVMDVSMKTLVETYPSMQVTFLRGAASLPFLLGATAVFGRWEDLIPHRWRLHLLRGVLTIGTLSLFVHAVSVLSLADTYAIFMSAPLLITALSVPLLGEQVGWRRWVAVLVGLIGVIVVLKPSGAGLITLGGLAALGSATMYAFGAITIRILSRTDTGAATVFWALFLMTIVSGLICISRWVPLQPAHWAWITGLGLSGAIGQYLFTRAFRLAMPASLAPLEYTALMWGMIFDWLLWTTAPSARMLCGAAIIVTSGLYVIYRERRQHSPSATVPKSVATPDAPP